jgi:hypothetical protein
MVAAGPVSFARPLSRNRVARSTRPTAAVVSLVVIVMMILSVVDLWPLVEALREF